MCTPTQTGLGERSHLLSGDITLDTFIEDVVNVLEWEDLTDVILVGHSFGGMTITGVADRVPQRIRRLVYVDAAVLQDGQSVLSLVPPETADARRELAEESSGGVSLPVPKPAAIGVTAEDDVAWLDAKMTPHPFSTYEDAIRLDHPVGNDLPVTYLAATSPYPVGAGLTGLRAGATGLAVPRGRR